MKDNPTDRKIRWDALITYAQILCLLRRKTLLKKYFAFAKLWLYAHVRLNKTVQRSLRGLCEYSPVANLQKYNDVSNKERDCIIILIVIILETSARIDLSSENVLDLYLRGFVDKSLTFTLAILSLNVTEALLFF